MAGIEAFTLLAVFDAVDRASKYITRIDDSFAKLAASAESAAGIVAEASGTIDASLLTTASGADAVELAQARVSAAEARSELTTRALAKAQERLLVVQDQIAKGALIGTDALKKQSAAMRRLMVAESEAAKSAKILSDANARLSLTQDAEAAASDKASLGQRTFGRIAALNSGVMGKVINASIGAGAAVAGIGYESIKVAANYQTLTTRLVTSANEQQTNLAYVRKAMMDLAVQTGTTATTLAQGMYVVESAGYHGADGINVLRAATEGARQEGADFGTVANAVTDVLKDYHLKAGQAANVTSQMVEAVAQGKTNFQMFSKSMANILPTASTMGISFANVSGVLAEMTNHGMSAQRASMNMANALRNLSGPTSGMTKEFKLLGGSTDTLQQKLHGPNGLSEALNYASQIAQHAGQVGTPAYTNALHKLLGTASGLSVALMTTGKNTKETADGIANIGKASADANGNVKGFSDVQDTLSFKMSQAKAAVDNMGIAIGTALIPIVTRLMTHINKLLIPLMNWIEKHQHLVAMIMAGIGILGAAALAIKGVAMAANLLGTALDFIMANPIVAAIAALVIILIYAYTHFKTFRTIANELGTFLKTAFVAAWQFAGGVIDWFSKNVMPYLKAVIADVFNWFKRHKKDFIDSWDAIVKTVHDLVVWFDKHVLKWVKARIAEFQKWWKQHGDEIKQIWSLIWAGIKQVVDVWWNGFMKPTFKIIEGVWKATWGALKDSAKMIWDTIKGVVTTGIHSVENIISIVLDVISGHWGRAWKDLKKFASQGLRDVVNTVNSVTADFGTLLLNAGENIVIGLWNGIASMSGWIYSQIMGWIRAVIPGPILKALGIGSPSKWAHWAGQMVGEGLGNGILGSKDKVEMASRALAHAVTGGTAGTLSVGLTSTVGPAGLVGGVGAGTSGGGNIYIDLREARVMSDRDMDMLVQKIGTRLAVRTLPAAGVHIRM